MMRYQHTCIESLATALPADVLTSAQIEARLGPLYQRLRLPEGRLELMTGIRERRVWPAGTRPSDASAAAGRAALARSALRADQVELFIHAAVCRDMLEPATASFAHRKIGLGTDCHHAGDRHDHRVEALRWLNADCHKIETQREAAQARAANQARSRHPVERHPATR